MIELVLHKENIFRKSVFFIILLEFICFIFSGLSFQGMHHIVYFNFGIDPIYWLFFLLQIPQFIFKHHALGITLDFFVLLMLIYSVFVKENKFITWSLFILLIIFYVSLTALVGHRNYQTGFFLMIVPFLFSNGENRKFAFEGIRYFYVFFYFSSGLFKIVNQGILDQTLMTSTLKQQFISYFLESNLSWRTTINAFLIKSWMLSYFFYCTTALLESFFIVGFFTKKFDYLLGIILLCFHFSNWIVMDIAPIGQLTVIYFMLKSKDIFH